MCKYGSTLIYSTPREGEVDSSKALAVTSVRSQRFMSWRSEEFSCECLSEFGYLVTVSYDRKAQEVRAEAG